jgi:CHAT domain-containing protein
MRLLFALALLSGLSTAAHAAPACPAGQTPAGLREEGYCTAQLALRSTIARSLGLLERRMAAGDSPFAAQLREAQDLHDQSDALAAAERAALGDKDAGDRIGRIRADRATVEARLVTVEADIRRAHPQWLELARPNPLGERETARLLRRGETMIVWYPTEQATFVWAIGKAGASWARIPLTAAELAERVAAFRAGLEVDGPVRSARADRRIVRAGFDRAAAAALYAQLFPGEIGRAVRDAKALILVPAGSLTSLPFAALPMGPEAGAPWLGLTKPLSLLPSPAGLRTLRGFPRARAGGEPFAGFGAPTLGGPESAAMRGMPRGAAIAALPSLPQAADELYDLARTLGAAPASVLVGAAATETAVKRADLRHVRVLAFATHGLVAGDVDTLPEPALVFTPPGAPDDQDDGLLTASEAARLQLGADWVILSACSTATGNRVGAESLSGLASAFTFAGARALLVSQWPVADDAARRLTTLAVSERGVPRAEALRRAMQSVAADPAHPEWADPAIWAVFEIVGEGGV